MLTATQDADSDNRDAGREAHLFIDKRDGQWEPYWWNASAGRPRYTFDMTGPIVDAVSGEMEQADFDISIRPAGGDSSKDSAKLLDGLIRNIENISNAKDIFNLAGRSMVTAGIDGWQVKQKYVDDDSFDQDLVIEPIANFIDSVWFGPFKKPDASDANWCVVLEAIPKVDYDEKYPDGSGKSVGDNRLSQAYFNKEDQIVIGNIYYITHKMREILQMTSGRVLEAEEAEAILDELAEQGETVKSTRRRAKATVKSRLFDGGGWLNDEQDTVFSTIPIVPTIGNFKVFENKLLYRGVVEKLLDAQRVFNYSKSREIEEGALAPRAKYWLTEKQMEGHEDTLATLNTNADPVQTFNHDPESPGTPQQNGGAMINPGLQTISADMRSVFQQVSGLYAANMGDNPGLQSGVALKQLQKKGDIGKIMFFKSQERAICRTARILLDAIPAVYSSERQIRILNEDGTFDMKVINQPVRDEQTGSMVTANDLSMGKYDVTCSAGASFQNRQQETVAAITEIAQVDPSAIQMGSDILFSNLPSPGMDLLAERKRKQLFEAGVIPAEQMTDEEKQLQQQAAQQPQQPDPLMVAAQAEDKKANADLIAQQLKQQGMQLEEQRVIMESQRLQLEHQKAQAGMENDRVKLATDQAKAETDRMKAAATINKQGAEVGNINADTAKVVQDMRIMGNEELVRLANGAATESS